MVYISRLFLVALTIISFSSWGELLNGKRVVCIATEEAKKKSVYLYPVRGFSFNGNKVRYTSVKISRDGSSKSISKVGFSSWISNSAFIEWGDFEQFQLNRKNLTLIHYNAPKSSDPNYYYYNCVLSDEKNFIETLLKYAEIEQEAFREAWKKATEGNKI